jgi:hypothetical protein
MSHPPARTSPRPVAARAVFAALALSLPAAAPATAAAPPAGTWQTPAPLLLDQHPVELRDGLRVVAAGLGRDRFLVVWGHDDGGGKLSARVLDATGVPTGAAPGGSPIGVELALGAAAFPLDEPAALAALPDGGVLVVWTRGSGTATGTEIVARRVDPAGEVGALVQVNAIADLEQRFPAVAVGADGRVLVVWVSEIDQRLAGGVRAKVVRGRLLGPDGAPTGDDLTLSSPGGALVPRQPVGRGEERRLPAGLGLGAVGPAARRQRRAGR